MAQSNEEKKRQNILKAIDEFAGGKRLKDIFKDGYVSKSSFYRDVRADNELWDKYTRAREIFALSFDEEIEQLKDDVKSKKYDYHQARLLADTIKWQASKFYPKMFGDKIDHTTGGEKIHNKTEVVFKRYSKDDEE